MIPQFPEFKKLELSDREEIEALTQRYPLYSDFEFTSLYAWDTKEKIQISYLHQNIAIQFTDYTSGDFFYTFIGNHEVNDTAQKLLELSRKIGSQSMLKLIPEVSAIGLDSAQFQVVEDRDNFDYLVDINILKNYATKETYSRKKSIKKFVRDFPQHKLLPLDLHDQDMVKKINTLIIHSNRENPERGLENELSAINRFIMNVDSLKHFALGIFLDEQLIAFVICDISKDNIAMGHFIKAKRSISPHLYSYVLNKMAYLLDEKGCKYLNFEQDLGFEGLRKWKMSFGPTTFLKKYVVSFADIQ